MNKKLWMVLGASMVLGGLGWALHARHGSAALSERALARDEMVKTKPVAAETPAQLQQQLGNLGYAGGPQPATVALVTAAPAPAAAPRSP